MTRRTHLTLALAALLAVAFTAGCDDDANIKGPKTDAGAVKRDGAVADGAARDATGGTDGSTVKPPKAGSFMTYNTALIAAVALDRQRLPKIIEALKTTRASVVCLQEVWSEADAKAISSGLKAYYPNSFWKSTSATDTYGSVPCDVVKSLALKGCVDSKCTPKGISAGECTAPGGPCAALYAALPDPCKRCLAANTDVPTRCIGPKAPKFSAGGRNGLLLLSWSKIENPKYTPFDTLLVKRGVITATIDGRTVQCTHMTADLDTVPYDTSGKFKSWADEHKGQIAAADAAGPKTGCRIFMGDMNSGPSVGGMQGELEKNYPEFKKAGYETFWTSPKCTFCSENPLAGVKKGRWIDHVFFKGCKSGATYSYSQTLTQTITVKNSKGTDVKTRLSDHYGVLVETSGL